MEKLNDYQQKELEIALTCYIADKHTQEECAGYIDGFKKALSLIDVRLLLPSLLEANNEAINYNEKPLAGKQGHFKNGINWALNYVTNKAKELNKA